VELYLCYPSIGDDDDSRSWWPCSIGQREHCHLGFESRLRRFSALCCSVQVRTALAMVDRKIHSFRINSEMGEDVRRNTIRDFRITVQLIY
jgi:hypothetical protein